MSLKISKVGMLIAFLVLVKLTIHLLTMTNYDLHRDAFLYYSLGEHLDWGFVSVPPVIGFFSKLATTLLGNTTFALRIFPALIGCISVILIAKIVQELKGSKLAILIAVLAFLISPAFLRSNTLFQPVSFNQFFWLLSGYLIVKLINTHNTKYWLVLFAVWGLAFLTKYSIAFFIVSTLLGFLLTEHRKLLKSSHFFIGGALGILIILPNLYWQYSHSWPLIHHMTELQKNQFTNVSIPGFLIDQLVMNFPGLIVWVSGLFVFLFFKAERKFRLLTYIWFFTVLILLLLKGKSYYTLGLYPILFALGGYAVDKYFKTAVKYTVVVFIVIISLPMVPLSLPVFNFNKVAAYTKNTAELTNRWEDGKIYDLPQDYADMTGWKELATIVIGQYNELTPAQQDSCEIFADNYGLAGAISFYGKKYGLPEPISFSDNYVLWAPDSIHGSSFIYINHELGDVQFLFNTIREVGKINNPYFRENGVTVYYCTNPIPGALDFYADKAREMKAVYRRK